MPRFNRNMAFYCLLIGLAASVPALDSVYYTRSATQIVIYGMVALSVDLLVGYCGLVTFGQAAFFGIGAYVTGILSIDHVSSALIVWPAAVLAATGSALIIGALALRTRGFQFIMVTLAFAQMIYYFWQSQRSLGGENGFSIPNRNTLGGFIDLENHASFYYVALALLIVVTAASIRLVNSQFGMVVQGIRDNQRRAAAIGFPPFRYKLVLFGISGGIAGLAGALMANQTGQVGTDILSWRQSGDFLAMVILGSSGTLIGPIFGAAVFVIFQQIVSNFSEHWLFYLGLLIVLRVLLFKGRFFKFLAPSLGAPPKAMPKEGIRTSPRETEIELDHAP